MIYTNANLAGRELGHTTVIRKAGGVWICACDLCGGTYESPIERIVNGSAAKNGCGCRKSAPSGSRPPGPMPKGTRAFTTSREGA